jgi:hypothetical protein
MQKLVGSPRCETASVHVTSKIPQQRNGSLGSPLESDDAGQHDLIDVSRPKLRNGAVTKQFSRQFSSDLSHW